MLCSETNPYGKSTGDEGIVDDALKLLANNKVALAAQKSIIARKNGLDTRLITVENVARRVISAMADYVSDNGLDIDDIDTPLAEAVELLASEVGADSPFAPDVSEMIDMMEAIRADLVGIYELANDYMYEAENICDGLDGNSSDKKDALRRARDLVRDIEYNMYTPDLDDAQRVLSELGW